MNEQIRKHGEDLKAIFGIEIDGDKLSRKVHSLEVKAHKLAEDYCNGVNGVDTESWEPLTEKILNSLDKLLNFKKQGIPVFVNGDARGYALKIDDEYVRKHNLEIHRDFGGYGILAPEFDGN
jgi:hypothetical protein